MDTKHFVLAALIFGACSTGRDGSIGKSEGELTADAAARAFGIRGYLVEADSVTALAQDGSALAMLKVSAPSTESRLVEMTFADAKSAENEVTRPVDGFFYAPLVGGSRADAIQLDPALTSFFAAHQLAFNTIGDPIAAGLVPSAVADCYAVTFAASCNSCAASGQAGTCLCSYYTGGSSCTVRAMCPRVECGTWYFADAVTKTQTCQTNGGCSQQANGFEGCSADCQIEY